MLSRSKVKLDGVDIFVLTIMTFIIEGSSFFVAYNWFIILVFVLFLGLFLHKGKKIDIGFIYILVVWGLINLFSAIVNGHLSFSPLAGSIFKLFVPYFAVKIIGYQFFEKFFRFYYVLVVTSSVFYIFEVLFPSVMTGLTPYLNFLEHWRMLANGDFYIFFYNHLGAYNEYHGFFPRNCGFMWEPGAYALFLNMLIAYRLYRDNYRITRPIVLMTLALISTFSTAGYFGFFVLLLFFIAKRESRRAPLLIPILFGVAVFVFLRLYSTADFMSEKLDLYEEIGADVRTASFEDESWDRVTRLGMAIIALENSVRHPMGDGVNMSSYVLNKYGNITGANSLAGVLMKWGWLGLIVLVIAIYKLKPGKESGFGLLLVVPLLISFSSNPYSSMQYLMYFILSYSLVCNNFKSEWEYQQQY